MVVYIDVIIFENFIINYFLIYITLQTIKKELDLKWASLAAFIGSIYVITLFFPKLNLLTLLPFKLLVAYFMIFVSIRNKGILFNIKATAVFILYSMVLAGLCFFIQIDQGINWNFSLVIINFSYKKLLLSLMILYIFIHRLITYVSDRKELSELIYNVDIFVKGKKKRVRAFFDTGNELREPVTNLPVILVEKNSLSNLSFDKMDKYYIPYNVINGFDGKLEGFKPDYITISLHGEIQRRNVIVAFCENNLKDSRDYEALLSRGIIWKMEGKYDKP